MAVFIVKAQCQELSYPRRAHGYFTTAVRLIASDYSVRALKKLAVRGGPVRSTGVCGCYFGFGVCMRISWGCFGTRVIDKEHSKMVSHRKSVINYLEVRLAAGEDRK